MNDVETTGFDALEQTFKNLAYKDKRNILISAYRRAVRPTLEQAKATVPIGRTRNLYKSLGVRVIRDEIGLYVGARIKGGFRGYHGHLIEDGTVERHKKSGASTGRIRPTKFFRRAVISTEDHVMNILAEEWYGAIEKFIVKSTRDR